MNRKIRSLGAHSCFLETQIFKQKEGALSYELKNSQFGDALLFFRNPDFQAEGGRPSPVNRMLRSLGTPSCFLETQIFKQKEGAPLL